MITIHDGRKVNEQQLKNIKLGGFFMFEDVLCRRTETLIKIDSEYLLEHAEEIMITEMPSGNTKMLNRDAWVEPIADRQISFYVED